MMKTSNNSREQILNALETPQGLTSREIAKQCGIGPPAVRFHLRNLRLAGEIEELLIASRQKNSGRKAKKYRKAVNSKFSNIDTLCSTLLSQMQEELSVVNSNNLHILAANLIGHPEERVSSDILLMNHMIKWLNEHKYFAVWEAGKFGPVIRFRNCPYRDIREGCNFLCQLDTEILNSFSEKIWDLKQIIDWNSVEGECVFIVQHSPLE